MQTFKGRPILAGGVAGKALVSRGGFNTLASFQRAIVMRRKTASCADQNNGDLYGKTITGTILCLPQTIGSTSGGLALQTVAKMGSAPKALLFSERIDSLAAAGVILADVWLEKRIVTVDQLGNEFLQTVRDGQQVEVATDGTVTLY
ncbi:MAG: aconitase X swivel domain-containing protein [Chloroflexota bacterium]